MNIKIKCALCKNYFWRSRGRVNEGRKWGWKPYCSLRCLTKSKFKSIELQCGNLKCEKKFYRMPKEINKVNQSFCSQSCAAHINNQKRVRKIKMCANKECGNLVRGELKYCSGACIKIGRSAYSPKELIEKIKIVSHKARRTPSKREVSTIADMCVSAFGSWNNAVIAAGLKPNRSHDHRMYKRTMTKAADGHSCDSVSEAIIDNWLSEHKIPHTRNVVYPSTNHRADWVIDNNIFVEYFGLAEDSYRYDRAIQTKKGLCCKNNIRLIEIYARDLYPNNRLKEKFRPFLIKKK